MGRSKKSISIHGLDEETINLLTERAKSAGTSVNKVVKDLLSKALGTGKDKKDHREEFLDLFGVWTEADERQFEESVRDLETVRSEDWK
jgi:plasmid stability protein